jgi:hypothetical protein
MSAPATLASLLWWLLGAVVLPLWLLAGFGDYLCHARTDIAHTSGRHESLLHLLQTVEIGVPMLVFLSAATTALTLTLMVLGVAAHAITSWRDLTYASQLRCIPPVEQYLHSFLNVLPWVALALVVILHWPVAQALLDPALPADWSLRLRSPAFDGRIVFAILLASGVFAILPGGLELVRTQAARRGAGMAAVDHASSSSDRSATKLR